MVPDICCIVSVIIFHFGPFFPLLLPKQPQKWKSKSKTQTYYPFMYVYQKLLSDGVRFLRYGAWQMHLLFLILGYFLPFYYPNRQKYQNFEKILKKAWEYHHFTYVYQKTMIRWCRVPEICSAADGQTDRRTEKVTYRGGCPT